MVEEVEKDIANYAIICTQEHHIIGRIYYYLDEDTSCAEMMHSFIIHYPYWMQAGVRVNICQVKHGNICVIC